MIKTLTPRLKANIDKLYFALPACSYIDIQQRSGLSLGDLKEAMQFVRRHGKLLGWTIPHGTRGSVGLLRFHCSLVTENGEFETDPGASEAVLAGERASLRLWATQCENQSLALATFAANHEADPFRKRLWRSLSREAGHMAEEARELIEMMKAS